MLRENILFEAILMFTSGSYFLIPSKIFFFFSSVNFSELINKLTLNPQGYLDFKKELDPQQINWPSDIIPILSPKYSASSKECVVIKIILFL